MQVTINEDLDLVPRCPHCEAELSEVSATIAKAQGLRSFTFGKHYAYACPSCWKILGFSQRKGFWAG